MIDVALFKAVGAASTAAAVLDAPLIPSALSLHHGQDDPEHVEKDLIQHKLVGATLCTVDVAGLAERVEILRNHWASLVFTPGTRTICSSYRGIRRHTTGCSSSGLAAQGNRDGRRDSRRQGPDA